jgi:hypothetical protein
MLILRIKWKLLVPLVALICLSLLYVRRDNLACFPHFSPALIEQPHPLQWQPASSQKECPFDISALPFNDLLSRKNYTRGILRPRFKLDAKFSSLETISSSDRLLPAFRTLSSGLKNHDDPPPSSDTSSTCALVIDIDVSPSPPTSTTHTHSILFGAATTLDRIESNLPSLLYFIGSSNASLFALVPPSDDLSARQTHFRTRGLDITLAASSADFTTRYFALVRALSNHINESRPGTHWISLIDDDTFFPSISLIADRLSIYSAPVKKPYYIGALTEASWQVSNFGRIAFGGAGVFLSSALLNILNNNYEECQSWGDMPGDQKLGRCVKKFAKLEVTLWPELHQWDMRGDPDGLFESGKQLLSMHHWASSGWFSHDVVKMSAVSFVAGDLSILRRWKFDSSIEDENGVGTFYVLTNGYSIVRYTLDASAEGFEAVNFDKTEHTWSDAAVGYEESVGPLRPKDQRGVKKKRWLLKDAVVMGGNVHQFYYYEAVDEHCVIELVWLRPEEGA